MAQPPDKSIPHVGQHRVPRARVTPPRTPLEPVRAQEDQSIVAQPGESRSEPEREQFRPNVTAYQRSFIEPTLDVLEQFRRRGELTGNTALVAAIEVERANLVRAASGLPEDAHPVER